VLEPAPARDREEIDIAVEGEAVDEVGEERRDAAHARGKLLSVAQRRTGAGECDLERHAFELEREALEEPELERAVGKDVVVRRDEAPATGRYEALQRAGRSIHPRGDVPIFGHFEFQFARQRHVRELVDEELGPVDLVAVGALAALALAAAAEAALGKTAGFGRVDDLRVSCRHSAHDPGAGLHALESMLAEPHVIRHLPVVADGVAAGVPRGDHQHEIAGFADLGPDAQLEEVLGRVDAAAVAHRSFESRRRDLRIAREALGATRVDVASGASRRRRRGLGAQLDARARQQEDQKESEGVSGAGQEAGAVMHHGDLSGCGGGERGLTFEQRAQESKYGACEGSRCGTSCAP
jgi:hypothetical protein